MPTRKHVSLAILCGGQSKRFGTDKGLHAPEGKNSLVVRAIQKLGCGFDEINVIVHDREQKNVYTQHLADHFKESSLSKLQVVADKDIHPSPARAAISGIYTAISASRNPYTMVLAVDQFRLREDDLETLCAGLDTFSKLPSKPAIAYTHRHQGDLLPLPSLWPKDCLRIVEQCMNDHILGVKAIMNHMPVIQFDPGRNYPFLIANANFQHDLEPTPVQHTRKERPWPISLI